MDFQSILKGYLNRRVCLELQRRSVLWGTLSTVSEDSLRLVNTVMVRDPEDQGWFEHMQNMNAEDNSGPHYAETVVKLEDVLAVTCVEDDIPDFEVVPEKSAADHQATSPVADRGILLRSDRALSTSLQRLSSGLRDSSESPPPESEDMPILEVERFCLEIGGQLVKLLNPQSGNDLLSRIASARRTIACEMGVVLPRICIRDDIHLEPQAYRFMLNGHAAGGGEILVGSLMMYDSNGAGDSIPGREFREPAFGLKAKWIDESFCEEAMLLGCTVCENSMVLVTHLTEVAKSHLHQLLSCEDVKQLVDRVAESNPTIVNELIPNVMQHSVLRRFLTWLLEERVSIRNAVSILESLAFHKPNSMSLEAGLQLVRIDMGHDICDPLCAADRLIRAIAVSRETEEEIRQHLDDGKSLGSSQQVEQLATRLKRIREPRIVVVSNWEVRRPLFLVLSRLISRVSVLAYAEVPAEFTLEPADETDEADDDRQ